MPTSSRTLAAAAILALAGTQTFCAVDVDESGPDVEDAVQHPGGKADDLFADGPMYLTGGFDGSKKFAMWVDTMEFARHIERDYGKPLHFTYFINSCYLDTEVSGSWIGKALSRDEVIARWALAQQAINEGHEIANHTVRHQDGTQWSYEQWRAELEEYHAQVDKNLFRPIHEPGVGPVFPRWVARSQVAGQVGASCQGDGDCDSGHCLPVSDQASFCTAGCNSHNPCPDGMACGAPDWNQDKDVCVPLPEFPVVYDGEVLFDEDGYPNLDHPDLKPYRQVGFRAPQLGHNQNLFRALKELGYRYDTSKILKMGAPARVVQGGEVFEGMYEFALMKNTGSLTVPMDYNYKVNGGTYERMLADYQRSIVDNYNSRKRLPWNIGHHFATWNGGAYWRAMKEAFEFAAEGCPDDQGQLRCDVVEFPSFYELSLLLDAKADGVIDPFLDESAEGIAHDQGCGCGDDSH